VNHDLLKTIPEEFMITPSDVIEYIFCPRFSYFEKVLGIPQNEDRRLKVRLGREMHEEKQKTLGNYLRKRLDVIEKMTELPLYSKKWHLSAKIDEVLFLSDGTVSPLDYKFAEWKENIFRPLYYQSLIYGILLEDEFKLPSNKGYVIFTRSSNYLKEVDFPDNRYEIVSRAICGIYNIIDQQLLPDETGSSIQCKDCTYWRVCDKGLS